MSSGASGSVSQTVYVNDNPIGETEVYHARRGHVSTVRTWRDDYTRETTPDQAREEGLRPCKQCFPASGDHCPACGYEAGDGIAPESVRCPNDGCRVEAFSMEDGDE